MLEGTLQLVVDDVSYVIRSGESFSFASHLPHATAIPARPLPRSCGSTRADLLTLRSRGHESSTPVPKSANRSARLPKSCPVRFLTLRTIAAVASLAAEARRRGSASASRPPLTRTRPATMVVST